jgi:hypothetical protein
LIRFKHAWKLLILFLALGPVFADVQPISLTFFGLYGSPVQPLGLAATTTDAFGFNILGEWNPSNYASLGLSFEQVTFYFPGQSFTYPAVNFEGRVFPFQNEKGSFSPYIYGGAGLGLSSDGSPQLKAGLGSRVSFIGPTYLDFAAGSHWIQSPGNFQYVDFRAGLSYSLELNPKPNPTPTPTVTPTVQLPHPLVSPVPTATLVSTATPVPSQTIVPASTPVVAQAPVTTLAQGKRYYRLGLKAYGDENFALAFGYFNKNLSLTKVHKRPYQYADTCAHIGVIYQLHAHKVPNHLQKALIDYKKALSIDKKNKIARRYYKKLKAYLARLSKAKPKPAPAPTVGIVQPSPPTATPGSSQPSGAITLN